MIKLFKQQNPKPQTTVEIIEEIHETFFTEVDRLLKDAKISKSLETDKQGLIEKRDRLKRLGFTNTKEVKDAEAEINRLNQVKIENESNKNLIEAINYFTTRYPQYKFITEESVKKICEKYGLVYGDIGRYTGTVPDKNLKHLEEFHVAEDDDCYVYEELYLLSWTGTERSMGRKFRTKSEYDKAHAPIELPDPVADPEQYARFQMSHQVRKIDMKCPLEIAAPISDFDMTNMEVKDHKLRKIEIPDPVVLKPVIFNNIKYYLIITAWGIESSDEIVVNQAMN